MAIRSWREDLGRKATTFADVHAALGCSTRMSILISLSRGPLDVSTISSRLGLTMSLLSNHLKILRMTGVVDYNIQKDRHLYYIRPDMQVAVNGSVDVRLLADDGSLLNALVPGTSPIMNVLRPALRTLLA